MTSRCCDAISCPRCHSLQLSSNARGISAGNALVGGLALGPVGLALGAAGSKGVIVTCLSCGFAWPAGKRAQAVRRLAWRRRLATVWRWAWLTPVVLVGTVIAASACYEAAKALVQLWR